MKLRNWLLSVGVLCCLALVVGRAYGEDKKDEKKPAEAKKEGTPAGGEKKPEAKDAKGGAPAMSAEEAKAMETWMKAMTPGPEHEKLKAFAGSWTYTLKMKHGGPESPWEEMAGTIDRKWVLGNRYLMETVTGPPIMPGMPNFEGMALIGYDNGQKKHWFTWVDNAGTGSMNLTGSSDPSGKVFTYAGEHFDCMEGKAVKVKHVLTVKDDKTHTMQGFGPGPDGKEFLNFDMTCTRK